MKKAVRQIRERKRSVLRCLTCWRFSNISIRKHKSWGIINLVLRFIKLVPVLTVARSIWIYKRTTGAGESAVSRSSFLCLYHLQFPRLSQVIGNKPHFSHRKCLCLRMKVGRQYLIHQWLASPHPPSEFIDRSTNRQIRKIHLRQLLFIITFHYKFWMFHRFFITVLYAIKLQKLEHINKERRGYYPV